MDSLSQPKTSFPDPWPINDHRKRIIYAPHHTIAHLHFDGIDFSTFLENGEFMLEMVKKYQHKVYFVFKPHPLLYNKLLTYWGKDKTDKYYERWNQPGYSHIEKGDYLGLFKHSDALIHDCGSFILEYMYTNNPVMYLFKKKQYSSNLLNYVKKALDLHYKGFNHEDIENFILQVIKGDDPLKKEREDFIEENLLPPNKKTACENIINALLGTEEYS